MSAKYRCDACARAIPDHVYRVQRRTFRDDGSVALAAVFDDLCPACYRALMDLPLPKGIRRGVVTTDGWPV